MVKKEELEKRIENLEIKGSLSLDEIYRKKSPNYKKTKEDFAVDYIRHELTEYDILTEKEIVKLSFPDNYHLLLKLYEKLYNLICSRYPDPDLKDTALSELCSEKRRAREKQARDIFLDFRRISQRDSAIKDYEDNKENLKQKKERKEIIKDEYNQKFKQLKEEKILKLIEIFKNEIYTKSLDKAPEFRNEFNNLLEEGMKSAQIPKNRYVHIFQRDESLQI